MGEKGVISILIYIQLALDKAHARSPGVIERPRPLGCSDAPRVPPAQVLLSAGCRAVPVTLGHSSL